MDSNAWLKELKEGDSVYVDESRYGNHDYRLTTVAKITPTGRIKVWNARGSDTKEFKSDGTRKEGDARWREHYRLVQYTEDLHRREQEIKEFNNYVGCFRNKNWGTLTLDQLRAIYAILREGKPEAKEE